MEACRGRVIAMADAKGSAVRRGALERLRIGENRAKNPGLGVR